MLNWPGPAMVHLCTPFLGIIVVSLSSCLWHVDSALSDSEPINFGAGEFWDTEKLNNRPIIGVLAQEVSSSSSIHYGDTYFMASYVSFLEMAGARVVPVRVGEDMDYYTSLFKKINGVVFPGGAVSILKSKYAKAAKIIFNLAKKANDAGDRFPIIGICLGHELLTALVTDQNLLESCDAEKLMLPINLTPDAFHSRMLRNAPRDVIELMTSFKVTANMHKNCLSPQNFTKYGLHKFFHVLSTNKDRKGKVFISTMEARRYPFYGVQWHPEKNIFIWDVSIPLNHSRGAVRITQYMANFFVGEARKSMHHYPDLKSEGEALIQNYQPVYTGAPTFGLNYYFNLTTKTTRNSGT